jgi:hypothetical protein
LSFSGSRFSKNLRSISRLFGVPIFIRQGQDANGDQCPGRDFRHQKAQRLEFSGHFRRTIWARDYRLRPDAKDPAFLLQELSQS